MGESENLLNPSKVSRKLRQRENYFQKGGQKNFQKEVFFRAGRMKVLLSSKINQNMTEDWYFFLTKNVLILMIISWRFLVKLLFIFRQKVLTILLLYSQPIIRFISCAGGFSQVFLIDEKFWKPFSFRQRKFFMFLPFEKRKILMVKN